MLTVTLLPLSSKQLRWVHEHMLKPLGIWHASFFSTVHVYGEFDPVVAYVSVDCAYA